jgi:hypothetical protein
METMDVNWFCDEELFDGDLPITQSTPLSPSTVSDVSLKRDEDPYAGDLDSNQYLMVPFQQNHADVIAIKRLAKEAKAEAKLDEIVKEISCPHSTSSQWLDYIGQVKNYNVSGFTNRHTGNPSVRCVFSPPRQSPLYGNSNTLEVDLLTSEFHFYTLDGLSIYRTCGFRPFRQHPLRSVNCPGDSELLSIHDNVHMRCTQKCEHFLKLVQSKKSFKSLADCLVNIRHVSGRTFSCVPKRKECVECTGVFEHSFSQFEFNIEQGTLDFSSNCTVLLESN